MAAIARDDCIIEDANAQYDSDQISGGAAESDNEDKNNQNTVKYSYIDNKVFQNEE